MRSKLKEIKRAVNRVNCPKTAAVFARRTGAWFEMLKKEMGLRYLNEKYKGGKWGRGVDVRGLDFFDRWEKIMRGRIQACRSDNLKNTYKNGAIEMRIRWV